ncbi:MAG: hypothetical protein HeimC2_32250 [Candidatus Heimdallarchaeota archaeon LC_2]|nr:MAG: hypothetical protein HeimC2_32250 [Candidatus Heimdallarchaeota archaeon LC_2]
MFCLRVKYKNLKPICYLVIRKPSHSKKKKSSKAKRSVISKVAVTVGLESDIKTFNEAILADVGDTFFLPQLFRWLSNRGDIKEDPNNKKKDERFWNHTAKVTLSSAGKLMILFGGVILVPFGAVLQFMSAGSNTKMWLEQNEKKVDENPKFKKGIGKAFVNFVNTVTITTSRKTGGIGKRIKDVIEQD